MDESHPRLTDLTTRTRVSSEAKAFVAFGVARALSRGGIEAALGEFDRLLPRSLHRDTLAKAAITAHDTDDLAPDFGLARAFVDLVNRETVLGRLVGVRPVPPLTRTLAVETGATADFVGEGAAVPLSKVAFGSSFLMKPPKLAAMTVATAEFARSRDGLEAVSRDLIRAVRRREDAVLLDEQAATAVRPASLLDGITATAYTDLEEGVADVIAAVRGGEAESPFFIASSTGALYLARQRSSNGDRLFPDVDLNGGSILGVPLITSAGAEHRLVFVDASVVFVSDGGVQLDTATHAALEMADDPTMHAATGTEVTVVSLWQANAVGLRANRFITWKLGAADGAAFLALPAGSP